MAVANKKVQAKPKKTSPAAKKTAKPAARKAVKIRPRGKGTVKVSRPTVQGVSRIAQSKPATKKIAAVKKKPAGKKTTSLKTAAPKTRKVLAAAVKKKTVAQKKTVVKKPAKKVAATKKPVVSKKSAATVSTAVDRIRALKGMLIAKRDGILKEAKEEISKYISGENRQLVDTAIDEGDWAVVDISEDLNLRRLDSHRKLLLDIDECLRKIQEGTYGVCEECSEEISQKRLNVIPTATLCIDCKENKEKMEALEQTIEI